MGVPDRLLGENPFCNEMIAPHLLRDGSANGMSDCPKKERSREIWGLEGPV